MYWLNMYRSSNYSDDETWMASKFNRLCLMSIRANWNTPFFFIRHNRILHDVAYISTFTNWNGMKRGKVWGEKTMTNWWRIWKVINSEKKGLANFIGRGGDDFVTYQSSCHSRWFQARVHTHQNLAVRNDDGDSLDSSQLLLLHYFALAFTSSRYRINAGRETAEVTESAVGVIVGRRRRRRSSSKREEFEFTRLP